MSRLEDATRRWHSGVEEIWRCLADAPTRPSYLASLIHTYGFIAPLEGACRYTPGLEQVLDTRTLTRAGLLAQDLLTLGLTPAHVTQLPQCPWITTFQSVPEALGWLYVQYCAALSQRGLRERIVTTDPRLDGACAYLEAVGEGTSKPWLAFERSVDYIAAERGDDIIDAANTAFAALWRWNTTADFERKTG